MSAAPQETAPATTIEASYVEKVEQDSSPLITQARSLEITNNESYLSAGLFLTGTVKPAIAQIHEHLDPICDQANKLHKTATGTRKNLLAPLLNAEAIVKILIGNWDDHIEELQRVENERLRKEQEDEEKRQEKQRLAEAESEQLEAATALSEGGANVQAEKVLNAAPAVRAPAPAQRAAQTVVKPKAAGVSSRKVYKAEVTDLAAFVRGVVSGDVPLNCLKVDQAKLNSHVRNNDGAVKYPGCSIFQERSVSGRA